jgi:DNA-binding GntR family transcriptional regulator
MDSSSTTGSPSATTRAYAFVLEQIGSGRYRPDTMISEAEVASELGISRTPVREAFQVLARENWLRIYPKRGALVVRPNVSEVRDLFEVREALETWILRKLDGRPLSESMAQRFRAALEDGRAAVDLDARAFRHAAAKVHDLIFAAADNPLMSEIGEMLRQRQLRVGMTLVRPDPSPEERRAILDRHRAIVESILAGDGGRASALLVDNLHKSLDLTRRPID